MIRTPPVTASRSSGSTAAAETCTTCTRAPVSRAASISPATARVSAWGGREARKSAYAGEDAAACR